MSEETVEKSTYKISEIQKMLDISKTSAYNMCLSGNFEVVKFGKRGIRVVKKSFDDWFYQQR